MRQNVEEKFPFTKCKSLKSMEYFYLTLIEVERDMENYQTE